MISNEKGKQPMDFAAVVTFFCMFGGGIATVVGVYKWAGGWAAVSALGITIMLIAIHITLDDVRAAIQRLPR
jgi:hypothetical protein